MTVGSFRQTTSLHLGQEYKIQGQIPIQGWRRLIRLQRIYNFLLLHAILFTVLMIYMHLYVILYDFWD